MAWLGENLLSQGFYFHGSATLGIGLSPSFSHPVNRRSSSILSHVGISQAGQQERGPTRQEPQSLVTTEVTSRYLGTVLLVGSMSVLCTEGQRTSWRQQVRLSGSHLHAPDT